MPGIDEDLTFHPLRIALLTVSDTRTLETDTSGDLLAECLLLWLPPVMQEVSD